LDLLRLLNKEQQIVFGLKNLLRNHSDMPKTFENEMVSYKPLPYIMCKFSLTINYISRPIIFADDTSVIISSRNNIC
jgi:hypothetical protein